MIEFGMIGVTVYLIARIADFEGRSEIVWGGLGLVLIIACIALIPFPYLRVLAGFGATFIAMIVAKAVQRS